MILKNKRGFSLIELIVAIVVLSIIAITAYARFISFNDDAYISTNTAMTRTYKAAIESAHLRWTIEGSPGRVQNLTVFGENVLDFNTNGWPIGTNKGSANDNIGRQNQGCTSLWNYLMETGPRSATNTSADYQSYRHSSNLQCSFVLRTNGDTGNRNNAQLGVLYNSSTGEVSACGSLVGNSC